MPELHLNLLTREPLSDRLAGRKLLDLLSTELPGCFPGAYGNWEPLRRSADAPSAETLLTKWADPFLWKGRKGGCQGSVFIRRPESRIHSAVYLDSKTTSADVPGYVSFLKAASVAFTADFALIHSLIAADLERGRESGTVAVLNAQGTSRSLCVTTHDLRKSLPDLYWGTLFGAPYVEYFGLDRLLSAPAALVERIGEAAVYMQLTEHPDDFSTEENEIEAVRRQVKEHLGVDAFFGASDTYQRTPPSFEWISN